MSLQDYAVAYIPSSPMAGKIFWPFCGTDHHDQYRFIKPGISWLSHAISVDEEVLIERNGEQRLQD